MELENLLKSYLDSTPVLTSDNKTKEFEIRFGSNAKLVKPLTQVDYENVVRQLLSCGFESSNLDGSQLLRITNEFVDKNTGMTRLSNVRCELNGNDVIKNYCKHNNIQTLIDMQSTTVNQILFTQKMNYKTQDNTPLVPVDVKKFNFRAAFQSEQNFTIHSNFIKNIINDWNNSKKIFRLINRVRFTHPLFPLFVDVSIVKSSSKENRKYVPTYSVQDSNVFNNNSSYEIELEIDNNRVGSGTPYSEVQGLLSSIKKAIRVVMCGLQNTKYPVPYDEQEIIHNSYLKLIHGEEHKIDYIIGKHFIGPSSLTLQMENISEPNEQNLVPNVRKNYCVTDKADGERRLLFIHQTGKIYMIDTNMKIIFTGAKTSNEKIMNTIIDGEYIYKNKNDEIINLYAAFDIYYVNKKDVRAYPFALTENDSNSFRLYYLKYVIQNLKATSILVAKNKNLPSPIRITVKSFYIQDDINTIFTCCSKIMSNEDDGLYEYNTDGIIFTPTLLPVGVNTASEKPSNFKVTWTQSFKWKPPEFNTIDFLVTTKKDAANNDETHHIYQEGVDVTSESLLKYKTLILRCGYDENIHGLINPYEMILQDNMSDSKISTNESSYKPVPFVPTNPYQEDAYLCNVILKQDGSHSIMFTEENEPFDENTIVEFQYIHEREKGWNWVPLRVRYDKTAELRNNQRNFGNAYHVANSNWKTIHYPIHRSILKSGENIPEQSSNEDVYYNRSVNYKSHTKGLRDFHNLYVKSNLIKAVSHKGTNLIDYSVGKAGDLSKWLYSGVSFVYGIDVSRDNIHNNVDGACARYIHKHRKSRNLFGAIFNVGNTSLNIMDGSAFANEKEKLVNEAVFGKSSKINLGKGIANHYGVGSNGFDVGSCQFSLHYFFETKKTLHSFIRNLSETIKESGYFIGTCYDGNAVFRLLSSKNTGEMVSLHHKQYKMFEIIKRFTESEFPSDENGLGFAIDVYQDTINQYFREYLVNFNYFAQVMEDYGFVIIDAEEAQSKNLPNGTGLFSELYQNIDDSYGIAHKMTENEKQISFLNRYFVFKKMRNVDAGVIYKNAISNKEFEVIKLKDPKEEEKEPKEDNPKEDNPKDIVTDEK